MSENTQEGVVYFGGVRLTEFEKRIAINQLIPGIQHGLIAKKLSNRTSYSRRVMSLVVSCREIGWAK